MGLSLNPANWAVTDFIQGQGSGTEALKAVAKLNPAVGSADAIKDFYQGTVSPYLATNTTGQSTPSNNNAWNPDGQSSANDAGTNENPAITVVAGQTTNGSGSGTGYDSESINFLNDQQGLYERLLQSVRGGLSTGLQTLTNSENQAKNEATAKQERALRDLNVKRDDMYADKTNALGRVDQGAQQLYDNLRRVLGIASGRGSSAYQLAAPNAVAKDASMKRNNVMTTFGRNERDLSTATEDTNIDYQDLLASIAQQRKQREQDLYAGVYGQEQSIQEKLAEIASERAQLLGGGYGAQRVARQPYMDRYLQLQNEMDTLPTKYSDPIAVRDLNVKTPQLSDFTVDKTALNANREMGTSDTSPYAQLLRKMREQSF